MRLVPSEPAEPAVAVKKSVTPDYIICLEDGKKFKSLKRHLRTRYAMTPDEYRAKWRLPTIIRWLRRTMPRSAQIWPSAWASVRPAKADKEKNPSYRKNLFTLSRAAVFSRSVVWRNGEWVCAHSASVTGGGGAAGCKCRRVRLRGGARGYIQPNADRPVQLLRGRSQCISATWRSI